MRNMTLLYRFFLIGIILLPVSAFTQSKMKIDNKNVVYGETASYKASWGFFTIGSAVTKIDRTLYKVGSSVCFKIDINGQTNGLARLFYVRDSWTSYIDTASITTHKSSRSIREGTYAMDEVIHFDHVNKKAEVKVYDKKSQTYVLKKLYDTPENIRDVIAGFMVFRLVDLSNYQKGDTFTINGFYEDEGYKIKVIFLGEETIKTERGKILCYKVKPLVPKNHVFDGQDAVNVWLSANKSKSIIRIRAKMFVGNVQIDLQK
ncbi:MAG: DUF3108 domain-containing protein [Paludibacter sp.]|nr:DUF3108 domain-containing protein [Paludibacter sp.]